MDVSVCADMSYQNCLGTARYSTSRTRMCPPFPSADASPRA